MSEKPMWVRTAEGSWLLTGVPEQPLRVRMSDGTWKVFGDGGGEPFRVRDKGKSWQDVTTAGSSSGIVYGYVTEFSSDRPLIDKYVHTVSVGDLTDETGYYLIKNVPLGERIITAGRPLGWGQGNQFIDSPPILFTANDPIHKVNLMFGDGIFSAIFNVMATYYPDISANIFYAQGIGFGGDTGWYTRKIKNFEWGGYNWDDAEWLIFPPSEDYPVGETFSSDPNGGVLSASAVSSMGWIGDENNTQRKYSEEVVSWYSIPMGMLMEDINVAIALDRINNPTGTWTENYELTSIQIIHRLKGYSVEKSQVPWMNHYYWGDTTIGEYLGVGALRYQGPTPQDTLSVYEWHNGVYTLPVIRDKEFAREEGDIVWTGNLNDLGTVGTNHGLSTRPDVIIIQTFDPTTFDVRDSYQYHIQTSSLPEPTSFPFPMGTDYTIENAIGDEITVKFNYHFW